MAFIPDGGVVKLTQDIRLVFGEVQRKAEVKSTQKGGQLVKFSIVAGVKDGTEDKLYIDCVAFSRQLVSYCADLDKGDPICAIGKLQSREYNGKTYYDLKLIWCNSTSVTPDTPQTTVSGGSTADPEAGVPWAEQESDESELPF